MRNTGFFKAHGKSLGFINGNGTDQYRLSLFMTGFDLFYNCAVLALHTAVNGVRAVQTNHRLIGWNFHHVQSVYFTELVFLCQCRTRHTRKLTVHTEIVLEGDGCKCFVLLLHLYALFCLDCLMQTIGIPSARHEASGKGIYNHNAFFVHHVIHISVHTSVRTDCLIDMMGNHGVFRIGQIIQPEKSLGFFNTRRRQNGVVCFFVNDIVGIHIIVAFLLIQFFYHKFSHGARQSLGLFVKVGSRLSGARNNQRCSRLVNENGIHLVHNGKYMPALRHLLLIYDHVIPQIIESELIVGSIGNIGTVSFLFLRRGLPMYHQSRGQAHKGIYTPHFFRTHTRQIIIDGYNMYTFSRQSVEISRKRCNQGFTFSRFHLGNTALVQYDTAQKLNMERSFLKDTVICFAHCGKGIRQNIVQSLPCGKACLQRRRNRLQFRITHCAVTVCQIFDLIGNEFQLFELTLAVSSKQFGKK